MAITPHMISLPVGTQGQRIFPISCDWSRDTEYTADFTSQGASNGITVVQSVFINNEKCTADISISISGTSTNYTVMAGQVGVFPIYANGLPKITMQAEQGTGQTFFAFANFTQSLFAYNAQQIAQAVSDETLREAADTNPQNGHTAVTTYDPAVVQAIKDMQAATGLDFNFDKAGNALVSINTDKDASGGIKTDVGNAALSGGALNVNIEGATFNRGSLNTVALQAGAAYRVMPQSAGDFNDPRLNFTSAGELKCQVGEITLNGGNVTVETGDKYDSNGSLISTLYDGAGKSVGTESNPLAVNSIPAKGKGFFTAVISNLGTAENCFDGGTSIAAIAIQTRYTTTAPRCLKLSCDNGPTFVVPLPNGADIHFSLPAAVYFPNAITASIVDAADQNSVFATSANTIVGILSV